MATPEVAAAITAETNRLSGTPEHDELFGFDSLEPNAFELQQEALDGLVFPEVEVKDRKSIGQPERYADATIYQERIRFTDGAVRTATYVVPDNPVTNALTVDADPWVTGDKGHNLTEIRQLAAHDMPTVWIHHQGRHRIFPPTKDRIESLLHIATSKGIARWATQDLAVVQSIEANFPADTSQLHRRGYSRSGMSGNAFIVQAEADGREVVLSHHEAECFPHALGMLSMVGHFVRQMPNEAQQLGEIAAGIIKGDFKQEDLHASSALSYLKTLDVHPVNLLNELLWIKEFTKGEAGEYAKAVRLDAQGIRIQYEDDEWAHIAHWLHINQDRPGIVTLEMPGPHTSGADRRMQKMKVSTLKNIAGYAMEHEGELTGVTAMEMLDPEYYRYIVRT